MPYFSVSINNATLVHVAEQFKCFFNYFVLVTGFHMIYLLKVSVVYVTNNKCSKDITILAICLVTL